jgi:hypothetical protein
MAPRLLVLDDHEGRIAGAPAMARLRELAEVTVLDRPLGDADGDALAGVRVLLAIRERPPGGGSWSPSAAGPGWPRRRCPSSPSG